MADPRVTELIERAIKEDVGEGDHTTLACVSSDAKGSAQLLVKQSGIISGLEIAQLTAKHFDPELSFDMKLSDGDHAEAGVVAFVMNGSIRSILSIERLVLNLMQRMSGISTTTSEYVKLVAGTKARILDTRKTTPGLRWFEKEAVILGGGHNHRFGLFDMILIKDNHVDAAGGIGAALDRAQAYLRENSLNIPVELEVRTETELVAALQHGKLDRIMLDNFSVERTANAVKLVDGRCRLESSGGITLETVKAYADTGVDDISVGALTHSVKSLDLSLKLVT